MLQLFCFESFFFEGVLVLVSSVVSLSRQGLAKRGCGECKHARFSCKVVPHYLPGTEMSAWQEEDVIEAFVASLAAPSPAAPSPAVPLERQKRRQQERCRRMVLGFKEVGGNAIKRLGDCVCDGVGSARLLLFNFQSACIRRTFQHATKRFQMLPANRRLLLLELGDFPLPGVNQQEHTHFFFARMLSNWPMSSSH